MMYKRILFLIPPLDGVRIGKMASFPHIGIGYLSEFMAKNGIQNEVIDMQLGYSYRYFWRYLETNKPNLICISLMTSGCEVGYDLIERIKERYINLPIVIGGPHPSILGHQVLSECKADFFIKGEGEFSLLELCQNGKIPSDNGRYKLTKNYRDNIIIEDLDILPFPTYEKFQLKKYTYSNALGGRGIPIISSRGCPYQCIFCCNDQIMGRGIRYRSPKNIVNEMVYWWERGIKTFFFMDDNFTFNKGRVMELCDLIEATGMQPLKLSVPQGVRADCVDYELLNRMKGVGFWFISFGIETGSDKILQSIKKGTCVDKIEKGIKLACDLGYEVGLFFIIGHPEETPTDFDKSLRLALRYPVSHAFFYHAIPFWNTELYKWAEEKNYLVSNYDEFIKTHNMFDGKQNNPFFSTPYFTVDQRKDAFDQAKKIEKLVKKNNMMRKLDNKYGLLGRLITEILYWRFFYLFFQKMYYYKSPRKVINFLIDKFNLGINQF